MSQSANGHATEETDEKLINAVAQLLTQFGYRVRVNEYGFVATKPRHNEVRNDANRISDAMASLITLSPNNVDAATHLKRVGTNHEWDKSDRVIVNQANRTCKLDGKDIELTTSEFDLLSFLAQNVGTIVSRKQLFPHLLGIEYDGIDRSIDLRITRLRRKLGDDPSRPQLIKTVRGVGYILTAN